MNYVFSPLPCGNRLCSQPCVSTGHCSPILLDGFPQHCVVSLNVYTAHCCAGYPRRALDRPLSVQFSPFLVPCLTSSSSLLVSRLSIHRVHQALSGFLLLTLQTINSLKVICGNYRAHLIISHLRDHCSSLSNIQWLENLCFIYLSAGCYYCHFGRRINPVPVTLSQVEAEIFNLKL